MAVAGVTEIRASCTRSFDDAIKQGAARATKTLRKVSAGWIENREAIVDEKDGGRGSSSTGDHIHP
jgi:flavin-binding protein dodecin